MGGPTLSRQRHRPSPDVPQPDAREQRETIRRQQSAGQIARSDVDSRRETIDAETSDSLKLSEPTNFRNWLTEAYNLRSIGDALCANLGRGLPLFRTAEGGGSRGTNMLEGLIEVEALLLGWSGASGTSGFLS